MSSGTAQSGTGRIDTGRGDGAKASSARTGFARAAWIIGASDLKLTLRYRSVIIWAFLMPVVFMTFFGFTFRSQSHQSPKAYLAVENRDGAFISAALIRELRKEPLQVVDTLKTFENATRTLVIAEGFTRKVLAREHVKLILRKSESSNMEASAAAESAIYRCLIRVAGELIMIEAREIGRGTKGISFAEDSLVGNLWTVSRARRDSTDAIRAELDTLAAAKPLISVVSSEGGRAREIPSGFQNSVPGNLVMFVLMAMVFSGAGITAERMGGVLRRFAYTPAGRSAVIAGKLGSRMAVAALQIVFLLLVGRFAFKVSLGQSPVALVLLMLAFAFCTGAFSILFGSLLRNIEQVSGIGVVSTLIMAALGGCWWPLEIVPAPFRVAAFFFPTGWATNGLHKLISFGYGLPAVILNVAVLAAFGAIFMLIAVKKLKWAD